MGKHLRFDTQVQGLDLLGTSSFFDHRLFLSPFAKGLFLLKGRVWTDQNINRQP